MIDSQHPVTDSTFNYQFDGLCKNCGKPLFNYGRYLTSMPLCTCAQTLYHNPNNGWTCPVCGRGVNPSYPNCPCKNYFKPEHYGTFCTNNNQATA